VLLAGLVTVSVGDGGAMGMRYNKKAPPGQTLFSYFLFSGPVSEDSKFFSEPVSEA
jgi:hypothetical protein